MSWKLKQNVKTSENELEYERKSQVLDYWKYSMV